MLRRNSGNPNWLVGIFLLLLLGLIIGPGLLPSVLPSIIPSADESMPCKWLRTGAERAEHQSLIGRTATNPFSIRILTSSLPNQTGQTLRIRVVITNNSMGTVAFYYNPDQVRVGDDGFSSGLGIVFNRATSLPAGSGGGASYPEDDLRLLGPKQSCVHTSEWPFEQILSLGLSAGQNIVKAYYRSTSPGISQSTNGTGRVIYADQGLWVGIVESESLPIPLAVN
jgi:hypothetical protein